jgi:hypothetical protein
MSAHPNPSPEEMGAIRIFRDADCRIGVSIEKAASSGKTSLAIPSMIDYGKIKRT